MWHYSSPIEKDVFINDKDITIIEPELEQVIFKKNAATFTLFNIIKKAKQINDTTFVHTINDIEYSLFAKDTIIQALHYKDSLGNLVEIEFSKQVPDKKLKSTLFHPKYPASFDLIVE